MNNRPIGLYDSGVGGLGVLKEIARTLPDESIIYLADSARVPYGKRKQEEIIQYNKEVIEFLIAQRVKVILAACNTSSAIALPYLQGKYSVPIIGLIEHGAQMAIKSKRIGVIATEGTVKSKAYSMTLENINPDADVFEQACPILVPVVEMGVINNRWTNWLVYQALLGLLNKNLDSLILGCTHFPHLSTIIQEIIGDHVKLLDPAKQVSVALAQFLKSNDLSSRNNSIEMKFFTTGSPEHFSKVARIILPERSCRALPVRLDLAVRAASA